MGLGRVGVLRAPSFWSRETCRRAGRAAVLGFRARRGLGALCDQSPAHLQGRVHPTGHSMAVHRVMVQPSAGVCANSLWRRHGVAPMGSRVAWLAVPQRAHERAWVCVIHCQALRELPALLENCSVYRKLLRLGLAAHSSAGGLPGTHWLPSIIAGTQGQSKHWLVLNAPRDAHTL